jgi:hypothetical protein
MSICQDASGISSNSFKNDRFGTITVTQTLIYMGINRSDRTDSDIYSRASNFDFFKLYCLSYIVMTIKDMRVNTRLDSDRTSKFNYIRQRTNQGASDIMKAAIDLYYEKLRQETPVKPLQLLKQSGLIGCAEGDADLSVNYKQYLTESLNEKYGHR